MKKSAGILLYKYQDQALLFLLAHPGGPFWKNKDRGSWSIPKGEFSDDENPLEAAKREFAEETGQTIDGDFTALAPVKLKSGKKIFAWAIEKNMEDGLVASNLFEMEWPPKSGKFQNFPEIDRIQWFSKEQALLKINPAQAGFIEQVCSLHNQYFNCE